MTTENKKKIDEYWTERALQQEQNAQIVADRYMAQIGQSLADYKHQLVSEIEKFYARYAVDNKMTHAEAKQYLTDKERREFKNVTLERFREMALNPDTPTPLLDALSYRHRISRKEALLAEIERLTAELYGKPDGIHDKVTEALSDVYIKGKIHQAKNLAHFGIIEKPILGVDAVEHKMASNWSGKTFSTNVWGHDAAVYKISEDKAIIQTLDFFTTMINDPYLYGQIAATNALSDVYAMGGEVISALNIVAFPENMDLEILHQILKGGAEKVHEAGGVLAGGHSIHDATPKYGLSVTGVVHPDKILQNNNCKVGDLLIVTKPLGVSIINTAHMVKECSEEAFAQSVKQMTTLNKYSAQMMKDFNVNSCTDITGFGFLGHLVEMLDGKHSAEVYTKDIPYIDEAYKCANEFVITAGGQLNRTFVEPNVEYQVKDFALEEIMYDPQTSGGLLISLPENEAHELLEKLNTLEIKSAIVGKVIEKQEKAVIVK